MEDSWKGTEMNQADFSLSEHNSLAAVEGQILERAMMLSGRIVWEGAMSGIKTHLDLKIA